MRVRSDHLIELPVTEYGKERSSREENVYDQLDRFYRLEFFHGIYPVLLYDPFSIRRSSVFRDRLHIPAAGADQDLAADLADIDLTESA